jgi:hypothetical protein
MTEQFWLAKKIDPYLPLACRDQFSEGTTRLPRGNISAFEKYQL